MEGVAGEFVGPGFLDQLDPERNGESEVVEEDPGKGGEGRAGPAVTPAHQTDGVSLRPELAPSSRPIPTVASPVAEAECNICPSSQPGPALPGEGATCWQPEPPDKIRTIRCPDIAHGPLVSSPCSFLNTYCVLGKTESMQKGEMSLVSP